MMVFAEVHPIGSVTAEPIAVDIVSTEATPLPEKAEPPKPQRSEAFDLSEKDKISPLPESAAEPQQQAALPTPPPITKRQPAPQSPSSASQAPAFVPPEPDLSIKYHVLLGLPPELPKDLSKGKSGDEFDAPALNSADIESSLVAEFRRQLKKCSKLPEAIAASDKLAVKLRVHMTPDGRLAAEPILIEATASAKGVVLMRGAMAALQACQPYTMLPADRYGEWKILDLSFTPRDFAG